MAYKEKDTKKWTAQWFETNAKGEKTKEQQSKAEKSENFYESHAARDHSSDWVDHNKSGR